MIPPMDSNIGNLSIEERIRLVEDVWDSIAADQQSLALTQEQKTEIDRRLLALERDGDSGRHAAEALADIKNRL
jgi:putative addiction module component (TIGR02574 family)